MEVLPSSGMQYVGDSDCAPKKSGTSFHDDGKVSCFHHDREAEESDGKMSKLLKNMEGGLVKKEEGVQGTVDNCHSSENLGESSYDDYQLDGQKLSSDFHEFDEDDVNMDKFCRGPFLDSENTHLIVDTIESESPRNNRDGESFLSEPNWVESDESVALWVKWRGKWQAGIRCARADCPLSTLRAKPTHDRKKYLVIFFPHTRNYSWADTLLVRSIDEFPEPIAYRSNNVGLKMVRDLAVARRYIMRKLAVGMLNVVDQFHSLAFIESARDVAVWKEFAMEASRCSGYSDLGRMLLKLRNMIMLSYINSDWVKDSSISWSQRCQNAYSAEAVELLKEELLESILWNEVRSLWEAPVQPSLSSEWKTWKQEAMKWFSASNFISNGGDSEHRGVDGMLNANSFQGSRKRPKLEVRRAETHATHTQSHRVDKATTIEFDSDFFSSRDSVNLNISTTGTYKEETTATATFKNLFDQCGGVVNEARGPTEHDQSKDVKMTPVSKVSNGSADTLTRAKSIELTPPNDGVAKKLVDIGSKGRQCIAYIEAKGRQCIRWANEGDVYCCVHLASRFTSSSTKAEASPSVDTQMCEGTTVLGTKCKHRALVGSSFCKKHGPKNRTEGTLQSTDPTLKRKNKPSTPSLGSIQSRDIVLAEGADSPLHVEPVSVMNSNAFLANKSIATGGDWNNTETFHCISSYLDTGFDPCHESPKRYSLYCDKHLPSWLKRARNGKSRIVSKEVFLDLLKECHSLQHKLRLHQACELFYKIFKSILSLRNPVPLDVQLQWALSEASKDVNIGETLMKLVYNEKERLQRLWGFNSSEGGNMSSLVEESVPSLSFGSEDALDDDTTIRCKICSIEFLDDQELGAHWMENHKKEAQWFFRGYACSLCLDSFTNKKILELHVQDRHHVQFVEQCMLLQCIPCSSHFGNTEQLWLHVLSVHPLDLRLPKAAQQHNRPVSEDSPPKAEQAIVATAQTNSDNAGDVRRFVCRFCGLKFDLLPDLGRHHQAAHMGQTLVNSRPFKRGIRYYAYKLKSGRLSRPKFKKGLGAVSYRIRNRATATIKKRLQATKLLNTSVTNLQPRLTDSVNFGGLSESQCSSVARLLFSEVHKTKPRPNNSDILAVARSSCCKVSLRASLEGKYGLLPDHMYLRAAKLCSERNIQVEWHLEGFVCPNGCKAIKDANYSPSAMPLMDGYVGSRATDSVSHVNEDLVTDECHYVLDSVLLGRYPSGGASVLCDDISFGKESVPVACIADKGVGDSLFSSEITSDGQNTRHSMPWESFTYVTASVLAQCLDLDAESFNLGCGCSHSSCCPETCDHVYLFDTDYDDARDIDGKAMHGRFPYDDKGRIILEEGYLVYECNRRCSCDRSCSNRVLQKGVRVKLEIFRTENKVIFSSPFHPLKRYLLSEPQVQGWGVRAGEPILRGTFICEYIGEVLDEQEADRRLSSYGKDGHHYVYTVDSHTNDMSRLAEGQVSYAIDATKFGNVSRFINHSCSPNLTSYQVLVDSMDYQRAHIGLYANQDIACGEELSFDYRYQWLPGEGYPCNCGSSKCRGRLY